MHKVTIESPDTNTKQTMEYKAILFIGIRNDSREGIECLSLGKQTDDAEEDAMYKAKLLTGLHTLEERVIESNKLLELISAVDPDFAKRLKGKAMNKSEYELKEAVRRIFNEGKE